MSPHAELTLNSARSETRVQVVGNLVEESGGHLLALVVHEIHLDRPFTLWEALNLRRLVTIPEQSCQLVHVAFSSVCVCVGGAEHERRVTTCRALILCVLLSLLTPKKAPTRLIVGIKSARPEVQASSWAERREGRVPITYIMCCCVTRRTVRLTYIRKSESAQLSRPPSRHIKVRPMPPATAQRAQSAAATRRQHFRTAQLDRAAVGTTSKAENPKLTSGMLNVSRSFPLQSTIWVFLRGERARIRRCEFGEQFAQLRGGGSPGAGRISGLPFLGRVKGRKKACRIDWEDVSMVYTVNGAGHSLESVVKGERNAGRREWGGMRSTGRMRRGEGIN